LKRYCDGARPVEGSRIGEMERRALPSSDSTEGETFRLERSSSADLDRIIIPLLKSAVGGGER
jgi:hypothetical protein